MSDMAFALLFAAYRSCCQIEKRQEEKGKNYYNVNRLFPYRKKLCENLFIKQIKCIFANDMVTEASRIQ